MGNKKKVLYSLITLALVFGAQPSFAAEQKNPNVSQEQAPIIVEADQLYFSDSNGDLFAKGNVHIQKDTDILQSDLLRGNSKRNEIWSDGAATLTRPGVTLNGTGLRYNYNLHTGSMNHAKGKVDNFYTSAETINVAPGHMVIIDGTVTGCPAEVPDYHISASKVELWPGDKMIAYDAKFWFKDTVLFSMPKYQTSLEQGGSTAPFPRLGFSTDRGLSIAQYLEYPVTPGVAAYTDQAYYTKAGYKPAYGLVSRTGSYTAKLNHGQEYNSDDEWIKKEPEFSVKLKPIRIGETGLTANFNAAWGKWIEGAVSGSRQDYNFYLAHEPIKIGNRVSLSLGAGYEAIRYGYDNSQNNVFYIDTTVTAQPSDRLETWAGYRYKNQSGTSPYEFDRFDTNSELNGGFMYKLDKMNGLGVKMTYEIDNDHVKDLDYTWRRNMHCWEADITYRAKREQVSVKVSAIHW